MKNEIWKPIKGYEGYYEVSSFGRVKTVPRIVKCKGLTKKITVTRRIRKPVKTSSGYLACDLSKEGHRKINSIHRLVAETFIPNPDNKPQVNHKNEIKTDNRVENLEWATCQENTSYSISREVVQLTLDGKYIRHWESASVAGRNGFRRTGVTDVCRGWRNKHKNYIWKYADKWENQQ